MEKKSVVFTIITIFVAIITIATVLAFPERVADVRIDVQIVGGRKPDLQAHVVGVAWSGDSIALDSDYLRDTVDRGRDCGHNRCNRLCGEEEKESVNRKKV